MAEKATIGRCIAQKIDYDDYRMYEWREDAVPSWKFTAGRMCTVVNVTRAAINETVGESVFDFPIDRK